MSSLINFEQEMPLQMENEKLLGQLGYNPGKMMQDLHQPCKQLIKNCYWLGAEVACTKLFHVTKTHVGYCCSFNANNSMSIDHDANSRRIPPGNMRVSGAGKYIGLSVTVDVQPENYLAPIRSFYGAEVFVHNPLDFPGEWNLENTIQPGWDVDFCVIPTPISASSSLERVPQHLRGCYLDDEGNLESNSTFSFNQCMSICRLRTMIKLCHCVPFYFSDLNTTEAKHVPVCTLQHVDCLRHFRKLFYSLRPPREVSADILGFELGMNCDCMQSCSFLSYNVQSISSFRQPGLLSSQLDNRNASNYSTLHVHFKDLHCIKYRREAFMTWDSLLAGFGGIFGLCMGGSVLSIVELSYYFFVKLFALYKREIQEQRLARDESFSALAWPKSTSPPVFRPRRYPFGYFERKRVIFRERLSSAKSRKRIQVQAQLISTFEITDHGKQKEPAFIY
ncbi:sodium channel protein Nach-like [Malaya genurostris]|uniref:sodium channel protein Nach-like n=1 Tax=Malaya genurostris TaxID=325434 RepID=UPI0026F38FC4|nr:sodium channel protein Nach-like [Malaya genurostris]